MAELRNSKQGEFRPLVKTWFQMIREQRGFRDGHGKMK